METTPENNTLESSGAQNSTDNKRDSDGTAPGVPLPTGVDALSEKKPINKAIHSDESRDAAVKSRKFRKSLNLPTISKAVRMKCLDCSGNSESDIRNCVISHCELWPFRMGRGPKQKDLRVAQFSNKGELTGFEPWPGYMK